MSESRYILQYGSLAGWPYQIASGLREKGILSRNVIREDTDVADLSRKLPRDRCLNENSHGRWRGLVARGKFVKEVMENCSLVHYHGGVILKSNWHHLVEGPCFSKRQIPMLMSFGGGDARFTGLARANNPYSHRPVDEKRDARIHAYLKSISRYIRHVATDPEMIGYVEPYFEECHVFRQPVDLEKRKFTPPNMDRPPILLHIPTEPVFKGTKHILEAVQRLKTEGFVFEFRTKRQLTQLEMVKEIEECDIYIDELLCGAYGVTAVETMAAGKPTVTYIRDDLIRKYPSELPIVNANPETIYTRLKELICDPSMRSEIAYASRSFVEKFHKSEVVVDQLIDVYKSLGWNHET